ncbi:MAG: class I SAM-dependent methyltransferase [Hyphomonadaceae bacterium]
MRLSFGAGGRAFNADQDWLLPQEPALQPHRDQIRRVSGGFDGFKFDVQGITLSDRLARVFERYARTPLSSASVLDWGVGSGRVARYFNPLAGDFHGADVDADNLAWCRDHLRGTYHHIKTTTPTPLPADRFDLIYGVSVMTHLTPADEQAWIAELYRLVKKGGLVLLTTLGPTSLMVMDMSHCLPDLAARGRIDLGENTILAGRVPEGYYRNVAHGFAGIHSAWGAHFEILDVLPAGIGIQDLVVLRPR